MEAMHVIPQQKHSRVCGQVSNLSSFAVAIMGADIWIEMQQNQSMLMECIHLSYTY